MHNEFTAIFEKDEEWYIAYCPEIPGANGQGKSLDECRENLAEAISLILEERRKDVLRGVPENAIKEVVTIKWKDMLCLNICVNMDVFWKERVAHTHYGAIQRQAM